MEKRTVKELIIEVPKNKEKQTNLYDILIVGVDG